MSYLLELSGHFPKKSTFIDNLFYQCIPTDKEVRTFTYACDKGISRTFSFRKFYIVIVSWTSVPLPENLYENFTYEKIMNFCFPQRGAGWPWHSIRAAIRPTARSAPFRKWVRFRSPRAARKFYRLTPHTCSAGLFRLWFFFVFPWEKERRNASTDLSARWVRKKIRSESRLRALSASFCLVESMLEMFRIRSIAPKYPLDKFSFLFKKIRFRPSSSGYAGIYLWIFRLLIVSHIEHDISNF